MHNEFALFSPFTLNIDLRKLYITWYATFLHYTVQPWRRVFCRAVQVKTYGVTLYSFFFSCHKPTSLNQMKINIAILYIQTTTFQVAYSSYVVTSNESLLQRQFFLHTLLVGISYVRSRFERFPSWHTIAAPNWKCCEGYIVPSMSY